MGRLMTALARELLALGLLATAPVSVPAIALGLWALEKLRPDPEKWRQWTYRPFEQWRGR